MNISFNVLRMKNIIYSIVLATILLSCNDGNKPIRKSPVDYVDPFIGTGFHGHTYPGATVPFGAVQLSPDTRRGNWDACSGYHYSDSTILGFSHTHLSGTGCIDLGDILFHPTTQKINQGKKEGYIFDPLHFSHQDESASPGYYSVLLKDQGIRAELTATTYAGMHRYTFPEEKPASIIIDLAHCLDDELVYESEIQKISDHEISGMRRTKGWVDNQYVYFVAQFSKPFRTVEFVSAGDMIPVSGRLSGTNIQTVVSFDSSDKAPVIVKVGLSIVSEENARENLKNDIRDFDFDAVKDAARNRWEDALSDIIVEGGTEKELVNFYTAVYHTKIIPNIVSDVNGEYRRHDMTIGRVPDNRKQYSTFSIWDTFRAWNPLMTLTDTTLVRNMVCSFLDMYDVTGELPIWPLSAGETGTMIGYHSVSVIADAYLKGIRGFDAEKALEAMTVSSDKNKKGSEQYIKYGFIPSDMKKESVSCLLEYAYDDWIIAQMARAMGKEDISRKYTERSQNYINVFDGSTCFFRGKRLDGNWETPFLPFEAGRAYTEATAWQYRFFVPHDVNGLVQLFGGTESFTKELDHLFEAVSSVHEDMPDITGLIGQYAHGNEPSHHMAYLYNYVSQPWKTQQMVRRILDEMYLSTPEGIVGNEDCGQMSAWYILSSLGIYPVCPGSNEFSLTSPLFEKAIIKLANGKTLTIFANEPQKNMYIKQVHLNGKEIRTNFITYDQLMEGGELNFTLSKEPDKTRGISSLDLPYSLTTEKTVSVPFISKDLYLFTDEPLVQLEITTEGARIRYTLDETEPTEQSLLYEQPFQVKESTCIKARGYKDGFQPGHIFSVNAIKAVYRDPDLKQGHQNGVNYQYYEGMFSVVSDLEKSKIVHSGTMPAPSIEGAKQEDHFGFIFSGFIYAPEEGIYEFHTQSDDGSVLYIGKEKVVDNDGSHAMITATGRIALKKGYHSFRLCYFEDYEGEGLRWGWKLPSNSGAARIPAEYLFIN